MKKFYYVAAIIVVMLVTGLFVHDYIVFYDVYKEETDRRYSIHYNGFDITGLNREEFEVIYMLALESAETPIISSLIDWDEAKINTWRNIHVERNYK